MHFPYFNVSKPENASPVHQQIEVLSLRHWPYLNVSQPENAIPEHHQINFFSGHHCPYFNVSHPGNAIPDHQLYENRIPKHQQIEYIAVRNYPYLNVSKPQNVSLFMTISKLTPLQFGTVHVWTLLQVDSELIVSFRSHNTPLVTIR